MIKIGLLSDTHAHWDDRYATYFADRDEIWHAGDIGSEALADRLAASLLAAKFLQGMPIAGAAGGLWDGRVTHRLLSYTDLCCRRRFLAKRRPV